MRLFIIGYKSSGKTTLGRKLAERLNLAFVDLDEFLEQQAGKTIPEIFLNAGEEEFRRKEREALMQVIQSDNILVSTGGGLPCHSDNMSLMEKYGDIIYLKVDDETLVSRLQATIGHRPVVKGRTEEELRAYVADLRRRCEHHYCRARFVIEGNKTEVEDICRQLRNEKKI
ncbi:MAG: AAA family ATPase [Bacteroidales bacterium]|nr:AAA family ATPase [Bacteroidales bacterium]